MLPLTPQQKQEVCRIVSIGCPREVSAQYSGVTPQQLTDALRSDQQFAQELGQAEAAVELNQMRSVQKAAEDPRNWRASVWWLERTAPQRYARRAADALTRQEQRRLLTVVTRAVTSCVTQAGDRARLVEKLRKLAEDEENRLLEAPAEGETPREDRE